MRYNLIFFIVFFLNELYVCMNIHLDPNSCHISSTVFPEALTTSNNNHTWRVDWSKRVFVKFYVVRNRVDRQQGSQLDQNDLYVPFACFCGPIQPRSFESKWLSRSLLIWDPMLLQGPKWPSKLAQSRILGSCCFRKIFIMCMPHGRSIHNLDEIQKSRVHILLKLNFPFVTLWERVFFLPFIAIFLLG